MQVKIRITTPQGQAEKTNQKLKLYLAAGFKGLETFCDNDKEIIWIYENDIRRCMKLQKKVIDFNKLMYKAIKVPLLESVIKKNISAEQRKELEEMLLNGTKIEILKAASIEELQKDTQSFWYRIKDKLGIK